MKKILILLAGIILFSGCGNDWIEVAQPHDGSVTPNVLYTNEQTVTNALVGTLDRLKEYYYDRHVTYGIRFYYLGLDWMGNDMVTNPGQWWTYENDWNRTILGLNGYMVTYHWRMFYTVINDANTKIANILDESCPISEPSKEYFVAQLRAVRALCYFNLVRVFGEAYTQCNPASALGVPIYTTPTDATTEGNDRATIAEVYAQILEDLNYAVDKLAASPSRGRADKYLINKNTALGWRAQVNLEMGSWSAAASDANAARDGYTLMNAAQYHAGFNDIGVSEWIWGYPFQLDQVHGYASLYSHLDVLRTQAGYKNFFVNTEFKALFSETDIRNIFVNLPNYPAWGQWTSRKFKDNTEASGDYGMLRAAEMYLIEAEGLAQSGQTSQAANILFELQSQRDPQAVRSGNTGQALIDEILVERRKELYAEGGYGFLDLKRYNKPMVRTGNHDVSRKFTVPAGSSMWVFAIPQSEFDRNKNITTNNPVSDDREY